MMKPIQLFFVLLIFSASVFANAQENKSGTLFQVSTISALAQGVYDGDFSYVELFKHGNFGLGTFNRLDGEMVAVDGKFYQIASTGKLREVTPQDFTPFAEVTFFKPDIYFDIENIKDFQALTTLLSKHFTYKNKPYAIRIDGDFAELKLRSVAAQKKPYPPLLAATKDQAEFTLNHVKGTIIGFWFPQYWMGIAVPGLHLHFINAERTTGGHVLEIAVVKGKVSLQSLNTVAVSLPNTVEFSAVDLSDESIHGDIEKAEKSS